MPNIINKLIEMPTGFLATKGSSLDECNVAYHNLVLVPEKDAPSYSEEAVTAAIENGWVTAEELAAEETRLVAEFNTLKYSIKRRDEYPSPGQQFEKIYDDGVDAWKTEMVDPVKAKWPKDNSGPV